MSPEVREDGADPVYDLASPKRAPIGHDEVVISRLPVRLLVYAQPCAIAFLRKFNYRVLDLRTNYRNPKVR